MIDRLLIWALDRWAIPTPFPEELVSKPVFLHWHLFNLSDGRRVGIHHFRESNDELHHDHVRGFISIGLLGGYEEQHKGVWHHWRAPWLRALSADYIHRFRVRPGKTSWSLIITSKETKMWYFYPSIPGTELPDHSRRIPFDERPPVDWQ